VSPASLASDLKLSGYRASTENFQSGELFYVSSISVDAAKPVGAHRIWAFTLRPEHPEIGDQRVVAVDQVYQTKIRALLASKSIILNDEGSWRQSLALRANGGHLAP
ncbi:hypothetical protein LTR94_025750, partial [Friedmanniomyces endolithicus]